MTGKKRYSVVYSENEFANVPQKKLKADAGDYTVHVYMGSPISDNIVLKRQTFRNINDFVFCVIEQLPLNRRNLSDANLLFNIFHHGYNDAAVVKEPNVSPLVKIHFDEFATNATLDTRTFSSDPIDLRTLIARFREELLSKNADHMTEIDKKYIRLPY